MCIQVGLWGFGKAGRAVAEQLQASEEVELKWIVRENENENETDYRTIPIHTKSKRCVESLIRDSGVQFILDFSSPTGYLDYGNLASKYSVGIFSAVSNYEQSAINALKHLSQHIRVLYSPNITLGINFIIIAAKILRQLAPHAGVEVIEEHFEGKKEISGTALKIAELLEINPQTQVNSIRLGGIVGRHEIIFGFPYQTIRLTHDSISRSAFGQGALYGLTQLKNKPPGFYTMDQLVQDGFSNVLASCISST